MAETEPTAADPAASPPPGEDLAALERPATVRPLPGLAKRAEAARATAGGWTTIKSDEEFAGLAPGTPFIDPKGVRRYKPLEKEEDYWNVPEGQHFIDPTGVKRQRPVYQGVDVGTQTLYDMAQTDSERRKVLERGYPGGEIKESPQGLYVDDGGILKKPGRGLAGVAGHTLAEAAPLGGMVVGGMLGFGGGLAGGPAAPVTAPAGGVAGSVMGAMAGRQFNNIVLSIAGVHDRSLMQDVGSMGMEGAMVAGGEAVGRGIGAVAPAVAKGAGGLKDRAAQVAAYLTGVQQTPQAAAMARSIAEQGTPVRPSAYMPEAPYLATTAEVFDVKFRAQNVLQEGARAHYERKAGAIAETLGFEPPAGGFTRPREGISVVAAGRAAQERAAADLARSDAALDARIAEIEAGAAQRAQAAEAGFAERQAATEAEQVRLAKLAEQNRADADALINQGFEQIEREIAAGLREANVTSNSGDLWQATARRFREINAAIKSRAKLMYDRGDHVAGGYIPPQSELAGRAQALINQFGPEFANRYPHVVQQLRDLAGVYNEKGELVKEPVSLTLGQLRNLRSSLRSEVDWRDLTIGIREGAYKHFAGVIDRIIKNPELPEQVRRAVAFYNQGDAIYAKNMPIYNSRAVKAVTKGVESGFPADATALADALIKEGFTAQTAKVKRMVGPNLWAAVAAADKRNMMDQSKTLQEGVIDAVAFAGEIVKRHRAGLLEVVHGRDGSAALMRQAEAILALNGKIPVRVRPGDSLTGIIEQARASAEAAKAAAKVDPIGVLERELKTVRAEAEQAIASQRKAATAAREADPLDFLVDPQIGAIQAAEKILDTPDLFITAAARFGEDSEAFQLIRQVAALRVMQRPIETLGRMATQAQRKIEPEVWKLIFGIAEKDASTLAREMEFLLGPRPDVRGTGSSIAAQSRVLNPFGAITGLGKLAGPVKMVPGVNAGGRLALSKFYALMSWASSNPATVMWLTKALDSGNEALRAQAWQVVARAASARGGAVGRGVAVGIGPPELGGGEEAPPE